MKSQVFIPRPDGFIDAEEFQGYVQPSTEAAIIVQRLACGCSEAIDGLCSDQTLERGMVLLARKDMADGPGPRSILHFSQQTPDAEINKWIAVLGDDQDSALVIGVAPAGLPHMVAETLFAALCAAKWAPIKAEATGLRVAGASVGGLSIAQDDGTAIVWTLGGRFPLEQPRDPILLVTRVLVDVEPAELPAFAVNHVRSLSSLIGHRPEQMGPVEIDGVTGVELSATAVDTDSQENVFIYQVVLGKRHKWYVVVGIAAESYRNEILPTFKLLARSLRIDQPLRDADAAKHVATERFQFD